MFPMGVLVIGRSGNLLAANRVGRHTLNHGGSISESGGVVTLTSATYNRKLQHLLCRARAGLGSQAALRVPRRSGKPLLILFVPIREEAARVPEDGPLALLIMNGPPDRPDPALLSDLFGFTAAESKVAPLFTQGKSVVDVARALEISENTTRNHLKHMYKKTTTRKQCELVHALLTSPAGLVVSRGSEETTPARPRPQRARAATAR